MSNIRFIRRLATLGLALGLALALVATGCGGTGNQTTTMTTSSAKVQIKIGDAPADSVLAFEVGITRADLVQQGGATVNVLKTPVEIELTHLAGTVGPLALADVPAGTYTGVTVAVSNVEVTYLPPGSTSPVEKTFALNTTVTVPFTSAITISNQPTILNFEFNVAQSLVFDMSGNVTDLKPVFTVSVSTVAPNTEQDEESGHVEDAVGKVSNIKQAGGGTAASFDLTPQSGGSPQTFSVDAKTEFGDGLAQFADLKDGMLVEVDAVTQTDGTLLATDVEMMEASNGMEADGIVIATTGSPVTSLNMLVQDDTENVAANMLGTTLSVDVSNAMFKSPMNDSGFSPLLQGLPFTPKFDNTTVAVGQRIQVNGASTGQMQDSFSANEVRLQQQALTGTVSPAVSGSNATFSLLLDADSAFVKLTKASSLNVYQVSSTKLKDISSIAQGMKVRVRGLLLFDGTNYQFVAARITQP
jgi:Domain of unknown function (DUF5666)/Domain of unknown function (DUF4382)